MVAFQMKSLESVLKKRRKNEINQFWGLFVRRSDPLPLGSLFGNHPGGVVFGRRPPRGGLNPRIIPPGGGDPLPPGSLFGNHPKRRTPRGVRGGGFFRSECTYTIYHYIACADTHIECVAACCSVSQCVAVCCSVLQCVAVCCSVLQCVAVCCSVLQSDVAVAQTPIWGAQTL